MGGGRGGGGGRGREEGRLRLAEAGSQEAQQGEKEGHEHALRASSSRGARDEVTDLAGGGA